MFMIEVFTLELCYRHSDPTVLILPCNIRNPHGNCLLRNVWPIRNCCCMHKMCFVFNIDLMFCLSQPAHRKQLGLLEKHKDYVLRAR